MHRVGVSVRGVQEMSNQPWTIRLKDLSKTQPWTERIKKELPFEGPEPAEISRWVNR